MSIITVSRESYSHGEEIARKVARELGYDCLGSDGVTRAVQDVLDQPFGLLQATAQAGRAMSAKGVTRKDVALFRSSFYDHMLQDNVVYHGLAGHLFLSDMPNVFKVRLVADMEDRVEEMSRRMGIDAAEARERIQREDSRRQEWDESLVAGHGEADSFDLSVNLHSLDVDRAAQIIVDAARIAMGGTSEDLQTMLTDLALASRIEAVLLDHFGDARAEVRQGRAYIQVEASIVQEEAAARKALKVLSDIEGIREAHVGVIPSAFVPF